MCAVWTFIITGDENVDSAVTNPNPQSQGQLSVHIRKTWHCYRLYLGFSVLQLYIWFSDCLYTIIHHLYVKICLPLLAKDKVSIKSINSWEALQSETGLILQFQLHCSAQTFEFWHTEGLGALYISQCT